MHQHLKRARLAAFASLGLMACAARAPATPIDSPTTTSAALRISTGAHHPVEEVPIGTADDRASTPLPAAPVPPPEAGTDTTLTDGQLAAIASILERAEIDEATVALEQTQDPKLKLFAYQLVSIDADVDRHLASVVQNENIAPAESSLGTRLRNDHLAVKRALAPQSGAAFDRAYASAQRKGQEEALHLFDETLIPGAKNTGLKAALQAARTRLVQQIVVAKQGFGAIPQD